jgi:hypothetical protein
MEMTNYNWSKNAERLFELLHGGVAVICKSGPNVIREIRVENGRIDLNQNTRFAKQWGRIDEFVDLLIKRMSGSFIDPSTEPRSSDTKDLMELGRSIAKTQELLMGMNEPRPSEGLLRQAHERGAVWNSFECPELSMEDDFEQWIDTLPPDPLAADKASIQTEFANGLERKLIDAYCTGDAIAAMKRFAGMEVENG